jgi:hypothetical protein
MIPKCSCCKHYRLVVLPGGVAVCKGCDTVDTFRGPPNMPEEKP